MKNQKQTRKIEAHTKVSMKAFDKGYELGYSEAIKQVLEKIDKWLGEYCTHYGQKKQGYNRICPKCIDELKQSLSEKTA